ncbi:MBL fold metallo-hydrolase [Aliibacillus thermotolerans]|uniref:MBL fold metallo-hydrolase n=1 Tax=Aliibacillus thermotolerans TaxID=1834418 RepID=A0ABW0U4Y2_9BACI|nr:MBL fold metallo-hydrolase [Aliibacillus thermotolerans]MDA3130432.1 MBL fold metallo-hydrolase [Aliibacillus thermotolerans]
MDIKEIEGLGYRIGIPIPFPMKYVYCYLFPQDDGYVLIDTGINDENARAAWESVFKKLRMHPREIKEIYVTHFHPDHSGLAGWLQQKTGAIVYMHPFDYQAMLHVWGEDGNQANLIKQMVIRHGTPVALGEKIETQMNRLQVAPLPYVSSLPSRAVFAQREWEIYHTPGHSDGFITFYDPKEKWLLSSDLILDPITPNISVWPRMSERPLHDYISSLHKIRKIPVKAALTSHGELVNDVKKRIDELIVHHEKRLTDIKNMADGSTAYQIAAHLFRHRQLNAHQWRFAIAETLAHLYYLEEEGQAEKRKGSNGNYYYELKMVEKI